MNPDFQKMLFADLYRLLGNIKGEIKEIAKNIDTLMYTDEDWQHLSLTVNGIVAEAEIIKALCQAMVTNADIFLKNGPYEGEAAGVTPLEGMVNRNE